MPITRLVLLCAGAVAILGCSSDSTIPVDTTGAPVVVAITGIKANGADLAVTYTVENNDTADVTYGVCAAVVEALRGGTWVGVTVAVPCYASQIDLVPGHARGATVMAHAVSAGEQLRVSLYWSYLAGSEQMVSQSDSKVAPS